MACIEMLGLFDPLAKQRMEKRMDRRQQIQEEESAAPIVKAPSEETFRTIEAIESVRPRIESELGYRIVPEGSAGYMQESIPAPATSGLGKLILPAAAALGLFLLLR